MRCDDTCGGEKNRARIFFCKVRFRFGEWGVVSACEREWGENPKKNISSGKKTRAVKVALKKYRMAEPQESKRGGGREDDNDDGDDGNDPSEEEEDAHDRGKKCAPEHRRARRSLAWPPAENDVDARTTGMYAKRMVTIPDPTCGKCWKLRTNDLVTFQTTCTEEDDNEDDDAENPAAKNKKRELTAGTIIDMYYDTISKLRRVRIRVIAQENEIAGIPAALRSDATTERRLPTCMLTNRVIVVKDTKQIRSMRPLFVDSVGAQHRDDATMFFAYGEYARYAGGDHTARDHNHNHNHDYVYVGDASTIHLADKNFTTIPPSALLRHERGDVDAKTGTTNSNNNSARCHRKGHECDEGSGRRTTSPVLDRTTTRASKRKKEETSPSSSSFSEDDDDVVLAILHAVARFPKYSHLLNVSV
jgi:hypothetical protein